jgi:hypothetical protein
MLRMDKLPSHQTKSCKQPTMQSALQGATATMPARKNGARNHLWTRHGPETIKCFFAVEYHNLNEQLKVSTSQSIFHGANTAYDITMALDNLALATTTNQDIVLQLTTSNQQLTATNKL